MRTEKQRAAARQNGAQSRGPVTAMGKDRIRSNALKHGLTARLTVWRGEDATQFQDLLLSLLEQFSPANDVEFLCVEEMAMAKWRLRRMVGMETAAGNEYVEEAQRAESTGASGVANSGTSQDESHGKLKAFAAAQRAGNLLTTLRQHEAAYGRAYQRAYRHLLQLRKPDATADGLGEG